MGRIVIAREDGLLEVNAASHCDSPRRPLRLFDSLRLPAAA
jgi:hypothetical protein